LASNGDHVHTSADGLEQDFWQAIDGQDAPDHYHYAPDGSQEWYQSQGEEDEDFGGDMWYWDEPNYEWCYYFAESETWACVSAQGIGCLETPLQNRVCYNRYNDEWLFADYEHHSLDFDNFQFFYYPEWAWGTDDQEWYLWDDLHDAWVVAAS